MAESPAATEHRTEPKIIMSDDMGMPPPMPPPGVPVVPLRAAILPTGEPTQWRRRRRRGDTDAAETDDDTRSVVSSQWQPDAADVEMMHSLTLVEQLPVGRMRLEANRDRAHGRRAKRLKTVDLGGLSETLAATTPEIGAGDAAGPQAMFADIPILAPADEHTGNALLCFLSPDTFVGFVELEHEGSRHVLKLTGSESLTECDKTLCGVQDCCGDKAYLVNAQTCNHYKRKRTYLARSSGVGDYVAFEGRGMRFTTDIVPGDEEREQVLRRHFGMLPRSARRDSVLCLGQMTLHWRGLGKAESEGGASDAQASLALAAAAKEARCGRAQFEAAVRRQDPLKSLGLELDAPLLDLAWRLLRWQPDERISAEAALRHPALRAPSRELVPQ